MVERGPGVDGLVAYTKSLTAAANRALAGAPPTKGVSGSVVIGLKPPARSRVWVVSAEPPREAELTTLLKAPLEAVPPPAVRGYNAFALNFDAWGGGKSKIAFMPFPAAWQAALDGGSGGVLPDAVFDRIWTD